MNIKRLNDDIQFYYDIDDLFDIVVVETLLVAQNILDNNGKSMTTTYQLNRDNRNIFNHILKDAASNVFRLLAPLAKDVENAFQYNEGDLASTSTTDETNSIVYRITPHDEWSDDMDTVIDNALEKAIISFVLKEWWKRRRLGQEMMLEESNFKNLSSKITDFIYLHNNPTIQYTNL